MGDFSIYDENFLYPFFDGVGAAVYFGNHAAGNDSALFQLFCVSKGHLADQGVFIVLVPEHAVNIAHDYHGFGVKGGGNFGCRRIGIDVEGFPSSSMPMEEMTGMKPPSKRSSRIFVLISSISPT